MAHSSGQAERFGVNIDIEMIRVVQVQIDLLNYFQVDFFKLCLRNFIF